MEERTLILLPPFSARFFLRFGVMKLYNLLLGLLFLTSGVTTIQGQGVRLDMPIEDFIQIYPDLAPVSLRFSGRISNDTLWEGLQWHQDFSFGLGSMTAGLWQSQAFNELEDCQKLRSYFTQITNRFDEDYGDHLVDQEDQWRFYENPDSALEATGKLWPYRVWHSGRTQIVLRYEARRVLDSTSNEYLSALGLRIEMATNTKTSPTNPLPNAPMIASMPIEYFGALYPQLVEQGLGFQGARSREEQIGSVQGIWTYWFDRGKLQHYEWRRGIPDIPSSNPALFDTLQGTAVQLIQAMENALGDFKDLSDPESPRKIYHWAKWVLKEEVVEVQLSDYIPGKGYGYYLSWRVSKN